MIADDDRGFLLADGLFETVLWSGGALVAWREHLARLDAGCDVLGLPRPEPDRLHAAAMAAIARACPRETRAAVRLTWTAGSGGRGLDRPSALAPRLTVSANPAPERTTPARLAISQIRRNEGSPTARVKSLAYLDNVLARREARRAGADEAIMLNTKGEVACAAAANLFWLEGDRLITPALEVGVLAGIGRAAVLAVAGRLGIETTEVRAPPGALAAARGLLLTNSLIGVLPACSLNGVAIEPHPAVAELAAAVRAGTGSAPGK
jgi:branched-subunit amino acid aminotransferase/4-amino-4-deoxychorismate lyase